MTFTHELAVEALTAVLTGSPLPAGTMLAGSYIVPTSGPWDPVNAFAVILSQGRTSLEYLSFDGQTEQTATISI